jgi:aromatic ring-cleaving dioxygenase
MESSAITEWHAHIYFGPESEAAAQALREDIAARFTNVRIGSWHHRNVGPHTQPMYQVLFAPAQFDSFVPWLALNRRNLAVLVHPETGDAVTDHTDHAIWMGAVLAVNTEALRRNS